MGCNGGRSWALCEFVGCPRSRVNMHENINNVKDLHWVPFILYSYRNIMRAYICYWCHRRNCRLRKIYNPFSYNMGMAQRTSGYGWNLFWSFEWKLCANFILSVCWVKCCSYYLPFSDWGMRIADRRWDWTGSMCMQNLRQKSIIYENGSVF